MGFYKKGNSVTKICVKILESFKKILWIYLQDKSFDTNRYGIYRYNIQCYQNWVLMNLHLRCHLIYNPAAGISVEISPTNGLARIYFAIVKE